MGEQEEAGVQLPTTNDQLPTKPTPNNRLPTTNYQLLPRTGEAVGEPEVEVDDVMLGAEVRQFHHVRGRLAREPNVERGRPPRGPGLGKLARGGGGRGGEAGAARAGEGSKGGSGAAVRMIPSEEVAPPRGVPRKRPEGLPTRPAPEAVAQPPARPCLPAGAW